MATAVLVAAPITSPRASKLEMGGVLTKNVPAATTTQLGLPEEMCRALEGMYTQQRELLHIRKMIDS